MFSFVVDESVPEPTISFVSENPPLQYVSNVESTCKIVHILCIS